MCEYTKVKPEILKGKKERILIFFIILYLFYSQNIIIITLKSIDKHKLDTLLFKFKLALKALLTLVPVLFLY